MKTTGGTVFKRHTSALDPPRWYIISPPFTVMRLWGEKTTTERGSWFKLKAKAVRQLTEDEITEARLQFQTFGIEFDDNS